MSNLFISPDCIHWQIEYTVYKDKDGKLVSADSDCNTSDHIQEKISAEKVLMPFTYNCGHLEMNVGMTICLL